MASTLEDLDRRASALERAQGDTTETLRWVVAKLGRIQAVQDEQTLRLERLETKFDKMDARLGNVESRLESVGTRLDSVETRLESVEIGLGRVEIRLGSVESKLDGLTEVLPGLITEAVRAAR
jgi:chromosome segregation ATPase